jgi:hypothetical protein
MDRIKTIVITNSEIVKQDGNIPLTSEYVELCEADKTITCLRINCIFIDYSAVERQALFIEINGEVCPILIQTDFEIKTEDHVEIYSLKINKDFMSGNITMLERDNKENNKWYKI